MLLVSLSTAIFALVTLLGEYSFFQRLDVKHNQRLLNSARAWIDHGFWNLGGFLHFQSSYEGQQREGLFLYKSHVSIYVLPHYFGLSLAGEEGFWAVVGWIPLVSSLLISLSLMVIAHRTTASLVGSSDRKRALGGIPWVAGAAAFAIAFSSEPIWSMAWNTFDGTLSMVFLLNAAAISLIGNGERRWDWLSTLFLLVSALVCARFGILLAIAMAMVKFLADKEARDGAGGGDLAGDGIALINRPPFRWVVIMGAFLLGASHYLRVFIYQEFLGFTLGGQSALYRFGFTHLFKQEGQDYIDYHTPLSTFTFLWRQSEAAIDGLPSWMNSYHFIVWTFAVLCFAFLVARKRSYPQKPFWELLLLLPLIWSVLLNQSTGEHPDLIAIFWLPAYVLGLSSALTWLYQKLSITFRRSAALWFTGTLLYLLTLWQIQYFLRAYPQLHR